MQRTVTETTSFQILSDVSQLDESEILERWECGDLDFRELDGGVFVELASTPGGFDPGWLAPINTTLADRGSEARVVDLDQELWDRFFGPLLDAIEDRLPG